MNNSFGEITLLHHVNNVTNINERILRIQAHRWQWHYHNPIWHKNNHHKITKKVQGTCKDRIVHWLFRALISVVFQPLCPACSLFLFRRINDDEYLQYSQHRTLSMSTCATEATPSTSRTQSELAARPIHMNNTRPLSAAAFPYTNAVPQQLKPHNYGPYFLNKENRDKKHNYTVVQNTSLFFIWLQFLQTVTDFYNICPTVFWNNLQCSNYSLIRLATLKNIQFIATTGLDASLNITATSSFSSTQAWSPLHHSSIALSTMLCNDCQSTRWCLGRKYTGYAVKRK